MECDLCKHESSVDGSLLCAICAEAIRRLLAIYPRFSATAASSSDYTQSGTYKSREGAVVPTSELHPKQR